LAFKIPFTFLGLRKMDSERNETCYMGWTDFKTEDWLLQYRKLVEV